MSRLMLGIRIPNRSYEQLQIDEIDLKTKTILQLKDEISGKINLPANQIELLFCGNSLDDNSLISALNIQPNSTIHVLKKTPKIQRMEKRQNILTKNDVQRIADLFGTVTGTQINVSIRINILSKIIMEYPEFRRNLGAQALIRDSVLFHSLDKPEVIEKVAENYPVICDAAEFIVKTTKKELAKNVSVVYSNDESPSDSISSSEEENNANQSEQARIRRISRDQLAAALQALGPSSFNSLSNIAQRNSVDQREANDGQSSSSSSAANRITQSLLNNALAQALFGATGSTQRSSSSTNIPTIVVPTQPVENMDTSENEVNSADNEILPPDYRNHQYANQLRQMREMGLLNDEVNLNVLLITNGNLENAVNLVLTSNFENDSN